MKFIQDNQNADLGPILAIWADMSTKGHLFIDELRTDGVVRRWFRDTSTCGYTPAQESAFHKAIKDANVPFAYCDCRYDTDISRQHPWLKMSMQSRTEEINKMFPSTFAKRLKPMA